MRQSFTSVLLAGALLIAPAAAFAGAPQSAKQPAKTTAKHTSTSNATHSTKGVVKSVNDTMLVITHDSKGKKEDMTLTLNASTQKQGNIAVGSPVSVRYRQDGSSMVATAVMAQQQGKAKTGSKK